MTRSVLSRGPLRPGTVLPVLAGCALLVSSCGAPRQAAPPAPERAGDSPSRIVSLSPGTTEILFAVGAGDRVVGVTERCDYPPEARSREKVGDVSTSIEKVVALKPDLVVADGFLNREGVRAARSVGLKVVAISPKSLGEVADAVETVARACGVPDRGAKVASGIRDAVERMRRTHRGSRTVRVLFVVQASPLWAAADGTFVDEMIGLCGGVNISKEAGSGGFVLFSEESAVAAAPDVILVTDRPALEYFLRSAAWKASPAVRKRNVIQVDPDIFLRPTPRIVEGLQQMSAIIGSAQVTR